jgi:hypothetical protein
VICIGLSSTAHAEKRVALVVGNSNYRNVQPLINPAADARLMADTLASLGFTVIGGGAQVDLDQTGFGEALREFDGLLTGADVALFYYAGHGFEAHGVNYLVPVDARVASEDDIARQMVDTSGIVKRMQKSGARLDIVLLDACRDNPFKDRIARASEGLAQMSAPVGAVISFATQPRTVALDGGDGHSPYTRALAETIQRPGLGLFRTFSKVGLAVAKATGGAQLPWLSSSAINGSFYFAGKPKPVSAKQTMASAVPAAASAPAPEKAGVEQVKLTPPNDPLHADLITDCDRLAGMPFDTGKPVSLPGVEMPDIKASAATAACEEAMRQYPDIPRFVYEAGRAAAARKQWPDARSLYEKAAAAGYAMAMNNIGGIFEGGSGYPINNVVAAKWYQKAVDAGEPVAMSNLGWLYEKGLGVAKDYAHASRLYEQATALGEPAGMNNLALMYMHGEGMHRDYTQARRLFEQCVALNDSSCMNGLGVLYQNGNGVSRDKAAAHRLFEKAAALGNPEAKSNLRATR